MRLDRFISQASSLSRAQAQRAIRNGSVTVAGAIARDPSLHLAADAHVSLDGQPLTIAGPRYFMLHKPAGYICATHDGAHPTVLDLLHEADKEGLHPAGRLDIDTTGLVLISPVLFVHGINGTPINFRALIEQLDRSKYQTWVYYYPSGARLANVADHLDQTMKRLQLQHGFTRYHVIAHSMGGLVSRGFLLRNQTGESRARIPLYITISTPWAGHKAAESGVKCAPAVVGVWNDMAPGSAYLTGLFFQERGGAQAHRPLPAGVQHHLLFGYKRSGTAIGECTDGTVTLASELYPGAQEDAVRLYGDDETHMGIDSGTSRLVNRLLDEASR